MTIELTDDTCNDCGFDSSDRGRAATIAALTGAPELVNIALGESNEVFLNRRPDDETWSPVEYVEHIREVFLHSRLICEQALANPELPYDGAFPPSMSEKPATLGRDEVVSRLQEETKRNAEMFASVREDQWTNAGLVSGMRWTLRFALHHIYHELLHHCDDIVKRVATDH